MTIIISDIHLEQGVEPHWSYNLAKKVISHLKPYTIVLNGDYLDMSYMSKYTVDAPRLTEGKRLAKDRDLAVEDLKWLRSKCKRLVYLEGNHEYRIQKTLDSLPAFEGLIELPNLLSLSDLKIEWIPEANQPWKLEEGIWILHGKRMGKYYASQLLDDYVGVSVIQGHCHRMMTFAKSNNLTEATYQGVGSGCLTSLHQSYENGRPTGHTNGFVVVRDGLIQNVLIQDKKCLVDGKLFSN